MHFHNEGNIPGKRDDNICSIVPEFINRHIAENGSEEQKQSAWKNLVVTEQLRGRRNIVGGLFTVFPISDRLNRSIFDAQHEENLPGKLVRGEGAARKGGTTVDEAYDYSGRTHGFFAKIFERRSIDNKGMRLDSTVHYGENYNMPSGMVTRWFTVMVSGSCSTDSLSLLM